jgi:osmoprotectant transport system permease protein
MSATGFCGVACGILLALRVDAQQAPRPVVVGSKPFAESYVLAEMFAQLLEARGHAVDRRIGLGATEIAFGALRSGAIDVYPEYTGTGLLAILADSMRGTPAEVFARVSSASAERWGVRWLPPLGFENTYAIAVRKSTADSAGLRTLSDLARSGRVFRAGFTPDFIGRADGLVGLRATYGLELREVRALNAAVKYQAVSSGAVDVIDGYSTDGLITRYGLTVLSDDRRFFPPYDAAAVVGARLQREAPAAVVALSELSGRIDVAHMRLWNERVEVRGEAVAIVARDALREVGLLPFCAPTGGPSGIDSSRSTGPRLPLCDAAPARARETIRPALVDYLWSERGATAARTMRHLFLTSVSLLLACLVAIPAGLWLERIPSSEQALRVVGVIQTVPGIALLAFMLPLLGIGVLPAIVALFLYSLYPIVRNTLAGVRHVDHATVDAARAVGMTPRQVLRHVRLPLAAPIIMAGVRTAAVLNVGMATLAAFIGAGGLGDPIVSGLALADSRMILSGAIPAALLALLVDVALGGMQRLVTPAAMRKLE